MIDKILSSVCKDYNLCSENAKFTYKLVLFITGLLLLLMLLVGVDACTASANEPAPIVSEAESPVY